MLLSLEHGNTLAILRVLNLEAEGVRKHEWTNEKGV